MNSFENANYLNVTHKIVKKELPMKYGGQTVFAYLTLENGLKLRFCSSRAQFDKDLKGIVDFVFEGWIQERCFVAPDLIYVVYDVALFN